MVDNHSLNEPISQQCGEVRNTPSHSRPPSVPINTTKETPSTSAPSPSALQPPDTASQTDITTTVPSSTGTQPLTTSTVPPIRFVPPTASLPVQSAPLAKMSDDPQSSAKSDEATGVPVVDGDTILRVAAAPTELRDSDVNDSDEDPSTKYKTRKTHEDPRDLVILDVIQRFFREGHGEDLRNRMVSKGYSSEYGLISWTWNEALGMKLCINGEHRLGAIRKQELLVAEGKADASTLEQFEKMEMMEYYDESGADIPISDMVMLSANANEKSSCVAPPSTADRMGTIVNYLKLNPHLHGLSIAAMTTKVHKKGVLAGLTARTLRRYVNVALVLMKNKEAENLFHKFSNLDHSPKASVPGGMSLTILTNHNFTSASHPAQVLCMVCVNAHHLAWKESGKSTSSPALTEASCGSFFKVVCRIASVVEAVAGRRDMSIYHVYDYVVSHTSRGATISASSFITDHVKSWKPMNEDTEAAWSRSMEQDVVERLLAALPQKVVPVIEDDGEPEDDDPKPDEDVDPKPDEHVETGPPDIVDLSASEVNVQVAIPDVAEEGGEANLQNAGDNTGTGQAGAAPLRNAECDPEERSGLAEKPREVVGNTEEVVELVEVIDVEAHGPNNQRRNVVDTVVNPRQIIEQTPPKKRRRTTPTMEVEEPPPKRTTRAQTASSRLVQSIEKGELPKLPQPTATSKPAPSGTVASKKKKSRAKSRMTKAQQAAKKRTREHDKFDDKVGPHPDGVTQQSEMYDQLLDMECADWLYDDAPRLFALRKEHPAVNVLGATGYLHVVRSLQRYCKFNMMWSLFPRGADGSERDKESHAIQLRETADPRPSMESLHSSFYGLLLRFHSELYRDGYAVISSLEANFGDEMFPCDKDPGAIIDMKKCIDTLFDYYAGDEHVPVDVGWWDDKFWNPITNVGSKEDINARAAGATRMFSPRHATNESLLKDIIQAFQAKLYVDLLLAALADVLRLRSHTFAIPGIWRHDIDTSFDVTKADPLCISNLGGRFILSGKDCLRQRPHCDFQQPGRSMTPGAPDPVPSYFLMVSGADGFYLYVWKGSHREINNESNDIKRLSEANVPCAVWVPPYSVLIGRGELHHDDAGWADWLVQEKSGKYKYSVRYHVYPRRASDHLGNHIYDKYYDAMYKWKE